MRMISNKQLKKILRSHKKWLNKDGGWRADLRDADLSGADLHGANLRCANLCYANLYSANLRGADLYSADLRGADLRYANLHGADLRYANLCYTDLSNVDLCDADLRDANLCYADLYSANLRGADLYHADLRGAKIEIELVNKFFPMCCPEHGSFIGWKKCVKNKIVKLEITEDAKRSSAYDRKCRCSKAKCLAIENIDGSNSGLTEIASSYDGNFIYRIGEVISVDNFDDDRRNECAPGIHFFITRQEAVEYQS